MMLINYFLGCLKKFNNNRIFGIIWMLLTLLYFQGLPYNIPEDFNEISRIATSMFWITLLTCIFLWANTRNPKNIKSFVNYLLRYEIMLTIALAVALYAIVFLLSSVVVYFYSSSIMGCNFCTIYNNYYHYPYGNFHYNAKYAYYTGYFKDALIGASNSVFFSILYSSLYQEQNGSKKERFLNRERVFYFISMLRFSLPLFIFFRFAYATIYYIARYYQSSSVINGLFVFVTVTVFGLVEYALPLCLMLEKASSLNASRKN